MSLEFVMEDHEKVASIETECYFLSAMMIEAEPKKFVNIMTSSDFWDLKHQYIWIAMELLLGKYPEHMDVDLTNVDPVSITRVLKTMPKVVHKIAHGYTPKTDVVLINDYNDPIDATDGLFHQSYLDTILRDFSSYAVLSHDILNYIKMLIYFWAIRGVLDESKNTIERVWANEFELFKFFENHSRVLNKIRARLKPPQTDDVGDVSSSIVERYKRGDGKLFYTLGDAVLDKMFPTHRNGIFFVVARPKSGKSSVLQTFALGFAGQQRLEDVDDISVEALFRGVTSQKNKDVTTPDEPNQNLRVLYVNLEDTSETPTTRMLSQLSGVPVTHIENGTIPPNEFCKTCNGTGKFMDRVEHRQKWCDCRHDPAWRDKIIARLERANERLNNDYNIRIINGEYTADGLETALQNEYDVEPYDVLIVDYIQRVKPAKGQTDVEAIKQASRMLTDVAKDHVNFNPLGMIVMCGAQINRDSIGVRSLANQEIIPQAHHVKGSGAMEEDNFWMLGIARQYDSNGAMKPDSSFHQLNARSAIPSPPLPMLYNGLVRRFERYD